MRLRNSFASFKFFLVALNILEEKLGVSTVLSIKFCLIILTKVNGFICFEGLSHFCCTTKTIGFEVLVVSDLLFDCVSIYTMYVQHQINDKKKEIKFVFRQRTCSFVFDV